ncbi:uncharacterized protein LOC102379498 [Alligator sinensis]|uniref:Uncharacterized protein LOC102379498 n=1 Tax=Alligator sinensis TaxID=38654 RepID=A0A3Q0FRZ9_ALLSI|nr:uncharacterized protein LOC102379498 [Alligator sinensis]
MLMPVHSYLTKQLYKAPPPSLLQNHVGFNTDPNNYLNIASHVLILTLTFSLQFLLLKILFPELQVSASRPDKPIPLTPPGSRTTTPSGSRNSFPPQGWTREIGRCLAPGSSNQDVNNLSECLSIQSCRAFLLIRKWDQRSQQLAEMERALVQLHGLKKLGVLRRKLWIEKEQQVDSYFQEREREWAEEEERLQRQKMRLRDRNQRDPQSRPRPSQFPKSRFPPL